MAKGGARPLQGCRVLVVEDDFLLAEALVEALGSAGALVVGPIGRAGEAEAFVRGHPDRLEAAILDVNLHGETSYGVADALASRGVPFLFATGYDAPAVAAPYREVPRCQKPVALPALLAALTRLMG